MSEPWLHQLEAWHDFYLLVGTAAATLMALMFVVVTLGPHVVASRASVVRAIFTPIIVYFITATLLPALMLSLHVAPLGLAALLGLGGIVGLGYLIRAGAHAQWRESHLPGEDWVWFVGLPILSYLLLLGAAIGVWRENVAGLYTAAIAVLLMLVIGIHNAWDVVLWIAEQPRP